MTISEGLLSQKPQEQHLNYSVAALMKQECDTMVGRRISARTAELEQMLQTKATCPGFLRVGHFVQVTHTQTIAVLTPVLTSLTPGLRKERGVLGGN